MKTSKSMSRGPVKVDLEAAPAGGWDIVSVSVNGYELPATRVGEFSSEHDAEVAAFARAEEHAKKVGSDN